MAEQKKRKNPAAQLLGWLIALTILATPWVYLGLRETVVVVEAVTVTKGPVEQTVSAISAGTVMAHVDSMVAAEVLGKVIATPVEEGTLVNPGDLLVELNHVDLDAQVALTEANLKVGQSRLEQLKIAAQINEEVAATQVAQAAAQLELAQVDFDRIKSLREQKAVSQADFDKVGLALRVAKESKAAALANQHQNLVRQEEVRSAEATIEQLEASVNVAKAAREKAFVRAPISGIVAKRNVDVGEAVTMGLPVVQVIDAGECYVEAPFDEANAAEIRVGQKARINLDTYRGTDFEGIVTYIAPAVALNPDRSRTMKVKIRVAEQQEKFITGMSADVTILVKQTDNALFAPSEALVRDQYAYIVEKGRAVRRKVTVGMGNWERREILDGLHEGDVLITSLGVKGIEDGVPVQIVESLDAR